MSRPARPLAERTRLWNDLRTRTLIAPSLLSADFTRLGDCIADVTAAGARVLHLDVMDGHFVPNITFGPPLVASIRGGTDLWLDAHLMITDPLRYIAPFAEAGADSITVHVETGADAALLRGEADRLGICLGLAIRPDTSIEPVLASVGPLFDLVLVMSVMPGFGGQTYRPGSSERLAMAASFGASTARKPVIEVDGGIGPGTIGEASRAGAGWLVAGSAVFRTRSPREAFQALAKEAAASRMDRI